ncbi:hypothetical protein GCM10023189_20830 [Nibrella saemangeumensis]|uniref:GLPGLI family protein n=1 Tax=Nibrella saemangeumensis TaxID=1084526 RepID=A0ABP8MQC1_9BACT
MKLLTMLAAGIATLSAGLVKAQPASGNITYEAMQKIDMSQMRIVINGQEVKPGSPDAPADIPDVRSFSMKLTFAGNYGKEEREGANMVVRRFVGGDGPGAGAAPQVTNLGRPFDETVYVDMADKKYVTVLAVKKDNDTKTYRAEKTYVKTPGWQDSDQTKKIAGFTCRKATVPFRNETYTVWYTTDLPFTYSPINGLAPEKGVVLQIESNRESFRATKVDQKSVSAKDVQPNEQALTVTQEQLDDLRHKALADFRQRMMADEPR